MTAIATAAKPTTRPSRLKLSLKPAGDTSPVDVPAPAALILPSSPEPIPLGRLHRAAENVRHTRIDEDVEPLADDIAAHGLLQSLIGYRGDGERVMIVGGGRRLQALDVLCNRFAISVEFLVPVLIRERDDAIELSLAENLQQRTMSPVDEFLAFRALMQRGDSSPADLAKRFGWKERTVRQRLRLAELAPEVLGALADREITLDAAMAYASSQDQHLQAEVFQAQAKRGEMQKHRANDIRMDLKIKGTKTDNPLFTFVGAESYERRGGGYEDDLFNDGPDASRTLANPFTLETAAREMVEFQMERLLPEWQARADLSPTIDGFLATADLRLRSYSNGERLTPPKGWVKVEAGYDPKPLWKAIRAREVAVKVLVGIDDKGKLDLWPRTVFVAKADAAAIAPRPADIGHTAPETPEQRAAREREVGIIRHSRRLAVGPFAGTPFADRVYWPDPAFYTVLNVVATEVNGVEGQLVAVQIFVTDEEVAAQRAAGAVEYDAELAARAAEGADA